jgi:(S)-2-hydroxyglutarate dehydrogenase
MPVFDFTIVGGGIVGLATGMILGQRRPEARLLLLEKEAELALHQTGRNSGVIHSGLYYQPGSFKARFARDGNRSMVEFCRSNALPYQICGKVVVATAPGELPGLEQLYERGLQHGLAVERLASEQVRELEPHVRCLAGMRVPSTGIVNYRQVSLKYAEIIRRQGGRIQTGARLERIRPRQDTDVLETSRGEFETRFLINCAGLYSDRVARMAGLEPGARIVPFRGEYYELAAPRRHLVRTLIYPVPNPAFPFLGVHFTRMIDGSVHAGPNAVLAFHREGYHKSRLSVRDLAGTLCYPGFWRLVRRYFGEGLNEMRRSFSKTLFLHSLQRMIPEVGATDLVPAAAGIRAQALFPDGRLVDDFLIVRGPRSLHVCNAPSPAATASLEIGRHIVGQLP